MDILAGRDGTMVSPVKTEAIETGRKTGSARVGIRRGGRALNQQRELSVCSQQETEGGGPNRQCAPPTRSH